MIMRAVDRWSIVSGCLLTVLLTNCSGMDDEPRGFTRSDSLTVEIVEVTFPPSIPLQEWTISPEPVLSIGKIEGEEPYLFDEVVGALRTTASRIVVANGGGAQDLRFFDSEGRFLRSAGRRGAGPGEFQRLGRLMGYRGDSLAVWDGSLRRISVFDGEGRLGRILSLSVLPNAVNPVAGWPDGRFLSVPQVMGYYDINVRTGWQWAKVGVIDESGESYVELAELQQYPVQLNERGLPLVVQFHGAGFHLVSEAGLAWCRQDTGEVLFFDADGGLRSIVRLLSDPIPVTQKHLDRRLARMEAEGRGAAYIARTRKQYEERPMADFFPVFAQAILDSSGFLWLQPYDPDSAGARFFVLDLYHGWVATVEIPAGTIQQVGENSILFSRTDDLGVFRVDLHALTR
jgi:hypothetical protein